MRVTTPSTTAGSGAVTCVECGRKCAADEVIQIQNRLICAACKPLVLQRVQEGDFESGTVGPEAETVRQAHIRHETSVKWVSLFYFLGGGFDLVKGLAIAAYGFVASSSPVFLAAALMNSDTWLGVAQIWLGIGLIKFKWWARIPAGILSIILLSKVLLLMSVAMAGEKDVRPMVGVILATGLPSLFFMVIYGYIIYLMVTRKGAKVFSAGYQQIIRGTPQIKRRVPIVVLSLFVILLLTIVWTVVAIRMLQHQMLSNAF